MSDYKIHVFELAWLTRNQINSFKSDFRLVAEYLRAKRKGKAENWSRQKLIHIQEVLDLLKAISNDNIYSGLETFVSETQNEKGGVTMCDFTQNLLKQGRYEGEKNAIDKIVALFSQFRAAGKTEEIDKAFTDREYLKKLMDEYQK